MIGNKTADIFGAVGVMSGVAAASSHVIERKLSIASGTLSKIALPASVITTSVDIGMRGEKTGLNEMQVLQGRKIALEIGCQ